MDDQPLVDSTNRLRGRGVAHGEVAPQVLDIGESPAWPAVTSTTSGRPAPSTNWWIFVLNPPRERPTA